MFGVSSVFCVTNVPGVRSVLIFPSVPSILGVPSIVPNVPGVLCVPGIFSVPFHVPNGASNFQEEPALPNSNGHHSRFLECLI